MNIYNDIYTAITTPVLLEQSSDRPWTINCTPHNEDRGVHDKHGDSIGDFWSSNDGVLAVRAVNMYEVLVDALRSAESVFNCAVANNVDDTGRPSIHSLAEEASSIRTLLDKLNNDAL